jgi:hypothetical protein
MIREKYRAMIESLAVWEMGRIKRRKQPRSCQNVEASRTNTGVIDRAALSRLAAFRAEQRRPFLEDSADLVREDREERHWQL